MQVPSGRVNYSHNTPEIRNETGAWAGLGGEHGILTIIKLCNLASGQWQAGVRASDSVLLHSDDARLEPTQGAGCLRWLFPARRRGCRGN